MPHYGKHLKGTSDNTLNKIYARQRDGLPRPSADEVLGEAGRMLSTPEHLLSRRERRLMASLRRRVENSGR